jgi:transglutaminase-like putative cysteine protease
MRVRHTTGYQYDRQVVASYNEARVTPLSTDRQLTIDARVVVEPNVRLARYWDYWGTLVHAFDIHVPHNELIVTATSTVETATNLGRDDDELSWSQLDDPVVRDEHYEFLAPTSSTSPNDELRQVAADLRVSAATPLDGVTTAVGWVTERLAYQKGSTSVSTSATEALAAGRGVCQDFVHVSLALLRGMGIPARYVSGYFHPKADAPLGDLHTGDSHAWLEAWTGGWRGIDPTNPVTVGERHVIVARGRDYRDVSPLKGVYSGAPSSTPKVTVELTRLS